MTTRFECRAVDQPPLNRSRLDEAVDLAVAACGALMATIAATAVFLVVLPVSAVLAPAAALAIAGGMFWGWWAAATWVLGRGEWGW